MKKKLALLLATVMTLSMVPTFSVSAASSNPLSKMPTVVGDSVLLEDGWIYNAYGWGAEKPVVDISHDDANYVVDGTNLILTTKNRVRVGDTFRVDLEGAEWFFRGSASIASSANVRGVFNGAENDDFSVENSVLGDSEDEESLNGWIYTAYSALYGGNPSEAYYGAQIEKEGVKAAKGLNWAYMPNPYLLNPEETIDTWFGEDSEGVPSDIIPLEVGNYGTINYGGVNVVKSWWNPNNALQNWGGIGTPTYNPYNGIWGQGVFKSTTSGGNGKTGTYFRFVNSGESENSNAFDYNVGEADGLSEDSAVELPYALSVDSSRASSATVTVLDNGLDGGDGASMVVTEDDERTGNYASGYYYKLVIPLVCMTDSDEVKVKVNGNNTAFSSGTYLIANTAGGDTKTHVKEVVSARDYFEPEVIWIDEKRVGSIASVTPPTKSTDKVIGFEISAPSGYAFDNILNRSVTLAVEPGLSWYNGSRGDGVYGEDYVYDYKRLSSSSNDYDESTVVFYILGLNSSRDVSGSIAIKNLSFSADENASDGDINLRIRSVPDYYNNGRTGTYNYATIKDAITNETFLAGKRVQWDLIFKTVGSIPTLVSGRYDKEDMIYAEDGAHKTAHVYFAENAVNAWWAGRQTIFTLPEVAKFRKVDITSSDNLQDSSIEKVYVGDAKKDGYVTVNGSTMIWNTIKVTANKKAELEFDSWISVESGYEGDIKLSLSGSAIPTQSNGSTVSDITIARSVNPVTVATKVTDIKIGYQFQTTQDITITETKPVILKGIKTFTYL